MPAPLRGFAAILFDFDGTLADSYAAIAASVNHVRGMRGLPALTVDDVKIHVGRGPEYLLTHTVPGGKLADDIACYRAHHPGVMKQMTQLLPGTAELLPALQAAGKRVGLCSNKPRFFSQEILEHLGIAGCFDLVLGPEDVPLPKPAPDMLLRALQRLDLPSDRVLYVGDMLVDIQTARAANVCVWAVATGSEARQALVDAQPDRLLNDLREMVVEIAAC